MTAGISSSTPKTLFRTKRRFPDHGWMDVCCCRKTLHWINSFLKQLHDVQDQWIWVEWLCCRIERQLYPPSGWLITWLGQKSDVLLVPGQMLPKEKLIVSSGAAAVDLVYVWMGGYEYYKLVTDWNVSPSDTDSRSRVRVRITLFVVWHGSCETWSVGSVLLARIDLLPHQLFVLHYWESRRSPTSPRCESSEG